MKSIFITLLIAILFSACGNNTSPATPTASSNSSSTSATTNTKGDAVFSYNLDGQKVSGGEADLTNNVFFMSKNSKQDKLSFFLGDAYQEGRETFAHSLRFTIPAKTGNTALTPDEDGYSVQLFLGNSTDDKYVVYANEDFSITLNNISASRVSGTFSGKLKILETTGTGKSELTVTDGSFDIPVSTAK
ncbi:MAG: hypothetical protein ABI091_29355 [Ferruginibacter sp.]